MRGVALTSPDAAQWVNLMRLNHLAKLNASAGRRPEVSRV